MSTSVKYKGKTTIKFFDLHAHFKICLFPVQKGKNEATANTDKYTCFYNGFILVYNPLL